MLTYAPSKSTLPDKNVSECDSCGDCDVYHKIHAFALGNLEGVAGARSGPDPSIPLGREALRYVALAGCGRAGIAVAIHTCASVCARKIFPGIQKFRETFAKVGCRSAKV